MDPPFDQNSGSHTLPRSPAFCPLRPSNRSPCPAFENSPLICLSGITSLNVSVQLAPLLFYFLLSSFCIHSFGFFPPHCSYERPLYSDMELFHSCTLPHYSLPRFLYLFHPFAVFLFFLISFLLCLLTCLFLPFFSSCLTS